MHYQKISSIKNLIEIDVQLIAIELDCNASDLRVICNNTITDSISSENFELFWNNIKNEGFCSFSFDDNTDLYLFNNYEIILHSNLNCKSIIFELKNGSRIENVFNSYK